MVRSGGRLVAATVALLEKKNDSKTSSKNRGSTERRSRRHSCTIPTYTDVQDSSVEMIDETGLKCSSSTDSGKDDHFVSTSSNSSTSDRDQKDLVSVCCREDFEWMGKERWPSPKPRDSKSGVKLRRNAASSSLERRREPRRERDTKSRSAHYCPPPPPTSYYQHQPYHDCRYSSDYYHYFRPPPPCDCSYNRFVTKPTTELEEQLRKLDGEKESLSLQVAVLTDQVEAQADKIVDLEKTLTHQKRQLTNNDDILQREILSRSSLETQKLELLAVVSELKRHNAALDRDILELRNQLAEERRKNKPPIAPRNHISQASSTPSNMAQVIGRSMSPSPSPVTQSPRKVESDSETTPHRVNVDHYRSLPRENSSDTVVKRSVMFGKTTLYSDQARCSSVPNLAETESNMNESEQAFSRESSPSLQSNAPKGIRKIFGKIKRSGSGNLDDLPSDDPFVRGGVRSTAGPRLYNTAQTNPRKDIPFKDWSLDDVCDWLTDLGLESSVSEARRWGKSGAALLAASPQEIDKELNIKASSNGLLRKKVHLMLQAERGGLSDSLVTPARLLEPPWVLRWLDDIGLPQYKNQFTQARVDGHMLHRLTMDDLFSMHITSALHVASIRSAIHVLRKEKFDGQCLIRRSDPESEAEHFDERVELWTNHRVMEWLRLVDLAEYAPNLRGSGVHGGLLVHEERFNDVLLASVLSIPPEKSLLRRHLSTHFKQLLGADVVLTKRQAESAFGYMPLTPTTKIKIAKRTQFTLKRKKNKYDLDDGELVCPLNDTSKSYTEISKSYGCLP